MNIKLEFLSLIVKMKPGLMSPAYWTLLIGHWLYRHECVCATRLLFGIEHIQS